MFISRKQLRFQPTKQNQIKSKRQQRTDTHENKIQIEASLVDKLGGF